MPMKNSFTKHSILPLLINWLWAILWLMLPLSRKGSVAAIWLLGILLIIQSFLQKPPVRKKQLIISLLLFLFFLSHAIAFFFDPDRQELLNGLVRKLSLLVIPLIILLGNNILYNARKWSMRGFYTGLVISGLHMIADALLHSMDGFEMKYWMYHEFTEPNTLGAVYYSWYISIAMISLVYTKQDAIVQKLKYYLLVFFAILLLLCASKLFVMITIPIVLIRIFLQFKRKEKIAALGVLIIIAILGASPVIKRFKELKNTDWDVITLDQYKYDTPLNGITLRLVQWRLAYKILEDQNAWLFGTGAGSRQDILDAYYEKYNLYTGNPELDDRGYLGYNFHNQFVETAVGTGLAGLVILLLIFIYVFFCIRIQLILPIFVYIVTTIFFFTESVLERQAGITMFCLLVCTFKTDVVLKSDKNE